MGRNKGSLTKLFQARTCETVQTISKNARQVFLGIPFYPNHVHSLVPSPIKPLCNAFWRVVTHVHSPVALYYRKGPKYTPRSKHVNVVATLGAKRTMDPKPKTLKPKS